MGHVYRVSEVQAGRAGKEPAESGPILSEQPDLFQLQREGPGDERPVRTEMEMQSLRSGA